MCSCNDNRSGKKCDQPYRYTYKCKTYLNLEPPACILQDPVQKRLYRKLYKNILDYNLEEKINVLVALPEGSQEQADAYYKLLNELVEIFDITLGTPSPRLTVVESDGRVIYDTSRLNTVTKFNEGLINTPHNDRPEIMTCQLFLCGVGSTVKYSNSVGSAQSYVAVRAGEFSRFSNTIRYSINV